MPIAGVCRHLCEVITRPRPNLAANLQEGRISYQMWYGRRLLRSGSGARRPKSTPEAEAPGVEEGACWRDQRFSSNSPRPALRKRDSSPFFWHSRKIAA